MGAAPAPTAGRHEASPHCDSLPGGYAIRAPDDIPVDTLPDLQSATLPKINPRFFDCRHQMPGGNLCLFQRETRERAGGDVLDIAQVLRRAEEWFMGLYTGLWPPDTVESELEPHFPHAADVLLAARFFASDVRGHGRFYMIPDLRRLMDASPDYNDACPMVITAMTEESGIIRTLDARDELSDIYPWIRADEWDPHKLAAVQEVNVGELGQPEHGYWWSLPAEPVPFRNGEGLLEILEKVSPNGDAWQLISDTMRGELHTANRHYIALQYPARSGGVEWLFLVLPRRSKRSGGAIPIGSDKRKEFSGLPVLCYRAHSAREEDLRRRNLTVIDQGICEKTVALIGLGALGSRVAELLAQAGVGRIRLCDADRLTPTNVARHVGGVSDFGATKVRVVMSRLRNINPRLAFGEADVIVGNAISNLDQLGAFMAAADLVISTTADESVESVINQVAMIIQRPVLYGRSLRRARMGRIFLVRPGEDACKACLAEYANDGRQGKSTPADWIDILEGAGDVLLHECGRPVIPGSAAALSFIATLAARVAIDFLERKVADGNHWIWTGPAASDVDKRLGASLSTFQGKLPPSPNCSVCCEPPVIEVVVDDTTRQAIVAETESSPGVETGGVLLGYVDENRRAVVTRATGPGPKAVKTAEGFHRDINYAQEETDRGEKELGDKGVYIGEWHSHLESAPEPSATDVRSLIGIAAAANYLTSTPVLVIAGYDQAARKVTTLRSWVFVAGRRFYRVPNAYDAEKVRR